MQIDIDDKNNMLLFHQIKHEDIQMIFVSTNGFSDEGVTTQESRRIHPADARIAGGASEHQSLPVHAAWLKPAHRSGREDV